MGTTYNATVEIDCWKQHACLNCGTLFRYAFKRKKTGSGSTEAAAQAALHKAVQKALQDEVDQHPCPHCGAYQPEMIGQARGDRHRMLAWCALIALVAVLILYCTDVLQISTAAAISAGVCGVLAAVHFLIARHDPNANVFASRSRALEAVRRGTLAVDREAQSTPPAAALLGTEMGPAHWIGVGLVLAGLVGTLSCELARTTSGWACNDGWYPAVIGAGENSYVYFPNSISSIKGYWNGRATATVTNAAELGLERNTLATSTNQSSWGNSISAKSSEKSSSSTMWMQITAPKLDQPEGKAMNLDLTLLATYPRAAGSGFNEATGTYNMKSTVTLAPPGAGQQYQTLWRWGGFGGLGLAVLGGAWLTALALRMRKLGNPTRILSDAEARAEAAPPQTSQEMTDATPGGESGGDNL